jgi:hypothetical protein
MIFTIVHFFSSVIAMSSVQTMKSVLPGRVRLDIAQRLSSERQDLGRGEFCPAGAHAPHIDDYGRPATANTLTTKNASCGHYVFSAANHMAFESNHRPYIPTAAAGQRGGDLGGQSRQHAQQNLYAHNDGRGAFIRSGPLPDSSAGYNAIYHQHAGAARISHDAVSNISVGK